MSNKLFLSVKLLAIIIVSALGSCNNDFLHVEQKIGSLVKDTIYMTDFDSQFDVSFNLAKAGNAHWRVLQYPAWMTISPMEDNFIEGKSSFQIVVPDKTFISTYGAINLPLVFDVDGVGLVQYPLVFFNFGRNTSSVYPLSVCHIFLLATQGYGRSSPLPYDFYCQLPRNKPGQSFFIQCSFVLFTRVSHLREHPVR